MITTMGRQAPLASSASTEKPYEAATKFCHGNGWPEPVHIRSGMNHVYRSGHVLVRVGANDPTPQLVLMAYLSERGLDVVSPLDIAPLQYGEWWITAWPWVDPLAEATIDGERLGRTVRTLHDLPAASVAGLVPLPEYRSFSWLDIRHTLTVISTARAVDDSTLAVMHNEATALSNWWDDSTGEGVVVCHADVHPHNVLVTADGQYLIDWDSICLGPRQLDHAALYTWESRWGGPPELYESFNRGYGIDFRNDGTAELLARFRNLVATINMVARGIDNSVLRLEADIRLRWWLGDPNAPKWTAQ